MENHGTAPTINQFAEFSAIVTRALPKAVEGLDMSALLRQYSRDGEELSRRLRAVFTGEPRQLQAGDEEQPQPEPVVPPAHKDICHKISIGDRNYNAIGFLEAGEFLVAGQIMLDRVAKVEGTKPINEAEWAHLYEHRAEFDKYPEFKERHLITEWRNPGRQQNLSCFERDSREWYGHSYSVEDHWNAFGLVLRRCS